MLLRAVFVLLPFLPAFGQIEANAPSFEVADVKVNKSGELRMMVDMQGGLGGRPCTTCRGKLMIVIGYHVRPEAVTGVLGAAGIGSFRVARRRRRPPLPTIFAACCKPYCAERFKLAIHRESKMTTAYALVLAKSGPKMRPSEPAVLSEQRCTAGAGSAGKRNNMCTHDHGDVRGPAARAFRALILTWRWSTRRGWKAGSISR